MIVVSVSVEMLTPTVALIEIDVAYMTCGDSVTGTQLAAVVPSGSVQFIVTAPSSTGIAPARYTHASTSGVLGSQSVSLKLASLIAPVVPVIRSAARFASASCSMPSTVPEPLISVYGVAAVNTNVEPFGAT